ncbi:MAG: hypothetical protein ACI9G1_005304 [Pirellulaceae bacterium]|jgi:hypothetical protein
MAGQATLGDFLDVCCYNGDSYPSYDPTISIRTNCKPLLTLYLRLGVIFCQPSPSWLILIDTDADLIVISTLIDG